MRPGTDIPAALVALEPLDEIDVIGMNCGVGPDLMNDDIRHLSRHSRKLLSVLPNAGLPVTRGDEAHFPLDPAGLAEWLDRFVTEYGANIVGGCCGTTHAHLKAVVEAGLKLCSGKAIINSINLEDGRKTLDPKTRLAKKYGAALVALTIDEKGQADTADWKFEVAHRIYDICVNEYKIPPTDLLFDPLVFPVSTGQEQTRKSAIATFEAIRRTKKALPGALTSVGLRNCSSGLTPYTRQVLNSVYLQFALEYGLDSAISHAAQNTPLPCNHQNR